MSARLARVLLSNDQNLLAALSGLVFQSLLEAVVCPREHAPRGFRIDASPRPVVALALHHVLASELGDQHGVEPVFLPYCE